MSRGGRSGSACGAETSLPARASTAKAGGTDCPDRAATIQLEPESHLVGHSTLRLRSARSEERGESCREEESSWRE